MTRRTVAGLVAVPLLLVLWVTAVLVPLPYVTYAPGPTLDVLAEQGGREIVQVDGETTYRDSGELLMTTVQVTQPKPDKLTLGDALRHPFDTLDAMSSQVNLFEAMGAWIDEDEAIYPYDSVYGEEDTQEESEHESAIQMVTSQDSAIAVALKELGHDVKEAVEIVGVQKGKPADGKLKVRDEVVAVDGTKISSVEQLIREVKGAGTSPVVFDVRRKGEDVAVRVTPEKSED
jgi:PDZ domain-containing protein